MKELPQLHGVGGDTLPPCIDRRDFLANSGLLAVAAFLAGACGDGQIGGTVAGPVSGNNTVTVMPSAFPALNAVGGIAKINEGQRPVALVRATSTTFRAFSMICTHEGTIINIVNGNTSFLCPNHGAAFASSGRRTGGQVTTDLVELQVTIDPVTGAVTVKY